MRTEEQTFTDLYQKFTQLYSRTQVEEESEERVPEKVIRVRVERSVDQYRRTENHRRPSAGSHLSRLLEFRERPANFPYRRIAALSHLIVRHWESGLFADTLEGLKSTLPTALEKRYTAVTRNKIVNFFCLEADDY